MTTTSHTERQTIAREDARQLLTAAQMVEQEAAAAEDAGRHATADRLQATADRLYREYRTLCGVRGPDRPLNAVARVVCVAFALPVILLRLIGDAVRFVLSSEPIVIADAKVNAADAAAQARIAEAMAAGLIDAPLLSHARDRQIIAAAKGETIISHLPIATAVAIPVELPVADLAPVRLLTYTPAPKAKVVRKLRKAVKVKAVKAKAMPAAARTTPAETLYVKRGGRHVALKGKPVKGETVYRQTKQGKRVRYAEV